MVELERPPSVVAHCDWSTKGNKRWMAVAVRKGQRWEMNPPEPVAETSDLIERLQLRSREAGALLIGFDFPIGLPEQYGELTGFSGFEQALREFGRGDWADWYSVAEDRSQISVRRPFYPMRPGGTQRAHLFEGLKVTDASSLLRLCERATEQRQAACMLFWTLGGNQVGKAAISGWREIIVPNLDKVGLWPFHGALNDLLAKHDVVLSETYPGDVYGQLGIPRRLGWSKRRQAGRRSVASYLLDWMATRPEIIEKELGAVIERGFREGTEGEDMFDAVVGLMGMLDVITGRRSEGAPQVPAVEKWEGWILGHIASQSD